MPFKDLADLEAPAKYQTLFKKELKRMNAEPTEFFFCEGFPQGEEKVDILVFGEVKESVVKALKSKGTRIAYGQCAMDAGKDFQMVVAKGKVPETKLKPIFKLAPGYSYSLTDAFAAPTRKSDEEHDEEQTRVRLKRALYSVSQTFSDMGQLLVDKSTYRKKLEDAAAHIENGKFKEAEGLIKETAKELAAQKPAIQEQAQKSKDATETELKEIAGQLKPLTDQLDKAEKKIENLQRTISQMQEAQRTAKRSNKKYAEREENIRKFNTDLDEAQEELKTLRARLDPDIKRLNAMKEAAPERLKIVLTNIESRLAVAENASKSAEESRKELEKLVGEMGEAVAWQDDQLGGEGHGTGRHGAQTGLDRQAMRAATEEGVTPDQPGNKAGVTRHQTTWNKVKITYEEDEEGKRVIKDKDVTAKNIVNVITQSMKSDTGSMWATPVLEREAVTTALKTANALKKYEKYEKDSNYKNFLRLSVVVPKPSKGPGWGYAVVKDGPAIDPGVALGVLADFEKGAKTLDQMFSDLNVKLVSVDGGAKMIPHAIVVFKRDNVGDAWKLVTHYPNMDLSASDVGWECERDWRPGSVKFKVGTTVKQFSNAKLA